MERSRWLLVHVKPWRLYLLRVGIVSRRLFTAVLPHNGKDTRCWSVLLCCHILQAGVCVCVCLVGYWGFTSWQNLRSYQYGYRLVTVQTHGDFIKKRILEDLYWLTWISLNSLLFTIRRQLVNRKPGPTLLQTQGIFNIPDHILFVCCCFMS